MRRRHHWVLFSGALIVFATFILKEAIGEHLKALIDSVDAAEGIFVVEKENMQLSEKSELLSREVIFINDLIIYPGRDNSKITPEVINAHSTAAGESMLRLNDETAAAERMLLRIPHDKGCDDEIKDIKAQLTPLWNRFLALKNTKWDPQHYEPLFNEAYTLEHTSWDLEGKTLTLSNNALQKAVDIREKDTRVYSRIKYWSYGLYALGWILGLISRFYGIEALTEE